MSATHPQFVAECFWTGVTRQQLESLERRLGETARESGVASYVGSTVVPGDEVVFLWFQSSSPEEVWRLAELAGAPVDRVIAVQGTAAVFPEEES